MAMNMREKIARAMCVEGGFDPDEIMPNDGPRWRYYAPSASAALSALKTATPEMVEAGQAVDGTITAEEVWSAMIRKAKG